jgi:hypothetical protein
MFGVAGMIRRPLVVIAIAVAAMGCGADQPSPSPAPTDLPTNKPIATATLLAGGPLSGTGKLSRGAYATPAGFNPAFSFSMQSDVWVMPTAPDTFGFLLVTPTLVKVQGIIALMRPVSPTVAEFEAQLASHGLDAANPGFAASELTIGGTPARSFAITLPDGTDAFDVVTANGSSTSAIGGPLSENQLVYVTTSAGPFLLVLSLDPASSTDARLVFQALLASITFD